MSLHQYQSPLTDSYLTANYQYKGFGGKSLQMGRLTKLSTGEGFQFMPHAHLIHVSILAAIKQAFENQVCLVSYQELLDDYLETLFDANNANSINK